MKELRFGRYMGYLLTITMGAFTLAYELDMLDYLNGSKTDEDYLYFLAPIMLSLGGLLTGVLMHTGRRKMLILCGLAICTITAVSTVTRAMWFAQIVEAIYSICYAYVLVVILLSAKEIGTLAQSGLGLSCFFAWSLLGYAVASLTILICNKSYPRRALFAQTELILLVKLMGLLPLLIQMLLLMLYYKNDPPAHLVEINEEDKALLMLRYFCKSPERATEMYNEMKEAADANKFFRMTWGKVCVCSYFKHVILCTILIFLRGCSGLYSRALALPLLTSKEQDIYNTITAFMATTWGFGSVFLVDRYSIGYLVRLGYLVTITFNIVSSILHVVCIYYQSFVMLLAIVSALTFLPFALLITVPVLKFTVILLCDKGVACAIIGYSLCSLSYVYPLKFLEYSFEQWGPLYLQLAFTIGSIVAAPFSYFYIESQSHKLSTNTQRTPRTESIIDHPHDRLLN